MRDAAGVHRNTCQALLAIQRVYTLDFRLARVYIYIYTLGARDTCLATHGSRIASEAIARSRLQQRWDSMASKVAARQSKRGA